MGFWKANSSSGSKEPAVEPAPPPPSDAAAASPLPTPSTTTRTTPATHAPIEIAPARSLFPRSEYSRLSTSFEARTIFAGTVALLSGVTLGMLHGSGAAALRYRAENAHRLPTDATGWYLYHKSKNYHAMRGGVREGARMGVKLCVWVSGFFMCEEAIDRARGFGENTRGDFGSTVVAGLGTAGAWSLWSKSFTLSAQPIIIYSPALPCSSSIKRDRLPLTVSPH